MGREDGAVVAGISDEQDHPTDPQVPLLDADPTLEGLKVLQSGLGLDHFVDCRTVDHDVGTPKVAGQRNGDLGTPPQPGTHSLMQSFDESQVSRVTDW